MSSLPTLSNVAQKWAGASPRVVEAIRGASARTGVSFDYLMDKAKQESSFKADAKAGTSSAAGLFQFIESTWMNAVKEHGDKFGLGDLSAKISIDSAGKAHVSDAATKAQILKLRENPEVASNLVAAMTQDNASYLENSLGGKVGETDLYMAHFLGLGGANKFLKAKQSNPMSSAADLFPAAAKANKNVFFNANGSKRSLDQVYDFFAGKMGEGEGISQPMVNGVMTAQAVSKPISSTAIAYLPRMIDQPGNIDTIGTLSQQEALNIANKGQRKMIDALLSGLDSFGHQDKENRIGGNLLSPYTAFVLAKLNSPDEQTKYE